jgi:hypothetical protein
MSPGMSAVASGNRQPEATRKSRSDHQRGVNEVRSKEKGPLISQRPFPVELPGIEPGSYGIPSRLLRAQSAMSLLGSPDHANKFRMTIPVAVWFPDESRDRTHRLIPLDDARVRVEGSPGLTDQLSLKQRERSQRELNRRLIGCNDAYGGLLPAPARFP